MCLWSLTLLESNGLDHHWLDLSPSYLWGIPLESALTTNQKFQIGLFFCYLAPIRPPYLDPLAFDPAIWPLCYLAPFCYHSCYLTPFYRHFAVSALFGPHLIPFVSPLNVTGIFCIFCPIWHFSSTIRFTPPNRICLFYRPVVHFVHSLGELLFPRSILHISSAPTLPLSSTSTT